jgi:hypothetical protein
MGPSEAIDIATSLRSSGGSFSIEGISGSDRRILIAALEGMGCKIKDNTVEVPKQTN